MPTTNDIKAISTTIDDITCNDCLHDAIPFEKVNVEYRKGAKRVGIFCSSSPTLPPKYYESASKFGRLLAEHGCALIYGGGSWGMMGTIASSAYESGLPTNSIVGIIPSFMSSTAGRCYGQTVLVPTMSARKSLINDLSDVFVALPGGFGTLDEVTEMLTWNQLGYINKLIAFLNTDGFYDGLWNWMQKAVADGFIRPVFVDNIIISDTPEQLIHEILSRNVCPVDGKFFTKG